MRKPEIRLPKALDAIADVVLAYRPKPKTSSSKKRSEKADARMKGRADVPKIK
jgi:hypothetical protein